MKKRLLLVLFVLSLSAALIACGEKKIENSGTDQFAKPAEGSTVAEIVIEDFGSIYVRFFPDEAPMAVENFVQHAKDGYYDGVKFHRVIADFMIQGGDPTGTGHGGESIYGKPFEDEFNEALQPLRGALCMANAGANTNGSQFFLVQSDSDYIKKLEEYVTYQGYTLASYLQKGYKVDMSEEKLDLYRENGGTPWLYGHHTVFGQIFKGYEVLDKIASVETNSKDVPLTDVIIKKVVVYTYGGNDGN